MSIERDAIAIGFTGPFGSGCSTAAQILADRKGYEIVRLSAVIQKKWEELNPGKSPARQDLQELGNALRNQSGDPGKLAAEALASLKADEKVHKLLIFDGIRNIGEIETLKDYFGTRFYLIAIECPPSSRWERVRPIYEQSATSEEEALKNFMADSERDKHQETAFGQQVQLCVDRADVLVDNDNPVTLTRLREKLVDFVDLLTGVAPRYAYPGEILMNMAYSASHGSKCLKRQVGAVLVAAPPNEMGLVVGTGFNENPVGTLPCVEERKYGTIPNERCYRDIERSKSFYDLAKRGARCPQCGNLLRGPFARTPPWRCQECKTDLDDFFWPERAMSICTAIHAEVAALMAAGTRAEGATLYTTTYPCFQCAEKILHAKVANIVFTEPYPDIRAAERLQEIGNVRVERFEGVRSNRFDEIFSRARPYISTQREVLKATR